MDRREFRKALLDWFSDHGREFYWRTDELTPFEILLTELLLKRTRAEKVDTYGIVILSEFDSPETVSSMSSEQLASILKPLGLQHRRAKNIQSVCQGLVEKYDGDVPADREQLLEISGIGQYTADAVLCFAYGRPVLVLDTNVIVVAEQCFGIEPPDDPRQDETIRPALEPIVPEDCPQDFNWALIDLGAVLKSDRKKCPLDLTG